MAKGKSKQPGVSERRGVDPNVSGTWENVLLEGSIDVVAEALAKSGLTVRRDVAEAALSGKLAAPKGDWVVLVQLHGHSWLFAEGTLGGELDGAWAASLSKVAKTRAIHLGHEDVSGTSFVTVYDRGKEALVYSSDGDEITLRGALRKRSWLDEFEEGDHEAPQDALVRELDAFVPEFRAWADKGKIGIETGQPDVLKPANVHAVALVEMSRGPTGKAAQIADANESLAAACEALDAAAARAALAAGADLYARDARGYTPLERALRSAPQRRSARQAGVGIARCPLRRRRGTERPPARRAVGRGSDRRQDLGHRRPSGDPSAQGAPRRRRRPDLVGAGIQAVPNDAGRGQRRAPGREVPSAARN